MKSKKTTCLSVPVISTPECSLVKIWPVKSIPPEKSLNILPPRSILHNSVHPSEDVELLISNGYFLNSPRWVMIVPRWYHSDSPWCFLGSCWFHSSPRWLFSLNIGLNFLVMIDWFSFVFTKILWWAGRHNWNRLD